MITLKVEESFKKLDNGVIVTDYFGDIANLLLNKPMPYRIIYNKYDDLYIIADAKELIHEYMTEIALDAGYLPNTDEFMKKNNIDIEDFDGYYSDNIIFLTDADITDKFGSYTDPYATSEYGYEYPITTGSIFTKAKYPSNYFERNFNDLYNKLKKSKIENNRVFDDYGWK